MAFSVESAKKISSKMHDRESAQLIDQNQPHYRGEEDIIHWFRAKKIMRKETSVPILDSKTS